jgi:integrase
MTNVKLKYVTRNIDRHGNARLYFRRPGKPWIRLPGLPGSEEFMAAYRDALAGDGAAPTPEKSLDWLCERYFKSTAFASLEEYTRRRKRTVLNEVCAIKFGGVRIGSQAFAGMSKAAVRKLRDMKSATPEAANYRLKQLAALFSWAVKTDLAKINPAAGVEKLEKASQSGYYTWTESDVEAFEAKWPLGTRPHLAMAVMLYLGVRRSDAVRLGPKHESKSGASITVEVWKGRKRLGKVLTLPILPPLRAAIEATPHSPEAYLVTQAGKPHGSGDSFGNWFRDCCRDAGLPECSPHGLRKIAAVRCAEAGATEQELMAMFGWDDPAMARIYTRMAAQKKMAENAAAKMNQAK